MINVVITCDDLRRFAVRRAFPPLAPIGRVLEAMAFVQADPIRAPARAQDLILRLRADGYRAGDLERQYADLEIEEDVFINYGFVTRRLQALMHPRAALPRWPPARAKRAEALLAFVRTHGHVHPRAVDRHFAHGRVTNYWGGSSSATTHVLEALHYRGLLRVVRRENGVRIYGPQEHRPAPPDRAARLAALDALVDTVVAIYAPLPALSLSTVVSRLRYAAPQWRRELRRALERAKTRLAHARVDGIEWYWPAGEEPPGGAPASEAVRLLAPFDPLVWDRRRFERLWGWAYRFEAYTPAARRQFGYYALPLLWRDRVIGWANVTVSGCRIDAAFGYAAARPRNAAFRQALEAEIERLRTFAASAGDTAVPSGPG
jgi:uncharacterized protein YcaQ